MITVPHLEARASRQAPAAPGTLPALTPSRPAADAPLSDRRPRLFLDQGPPNRRSVASAKSRVPLRRKRPAGTQGDGDIDEPSVVTGRARGLDHHAASEIDAPGPCLTPTCGGRTRRPRTEEWPLPDDHPRSQHQLEPLTRAARLQKRVRPQFLSLRQHRFRGQSLCLPIGPKKHRDSPIFSGRLFTSGCDPHLEGVLLHIHPLDDPSLLGREQVVQTVAKSASMSAEPVLANRSKIRRTSAASLSTTPAAALDLIAERWRADDATRTGPSGWPIRASARRRFLP